VLEARLRGVNAKSGGRFEVFLLEENAPNDWWTLMKPGRRGHIGTQIVLLDKNLIPSDITATVVEINQEGHRRVCFSNTSNILEDLQALGEIPLPPYIKRPGVSSLVLDAERYQTVYANDKGSLAAPTAGLHFTTEILTHLQDQKVQVAYVTLHVGLGTFAPVKAERLEDHVMHEERYEVSPTAADLINSAKREGRPVVAVGTTSLRVLETLGRLHQGSIVPGHGRTSIFIHPPSTFSVVDALLTNFHLPKSTLLMLVSAFASPGDMNGREMILQAYAEAVRARYRFFSYGDAMLIL
jgi:S-adenosylmethionine:tRNA ribosyltransferase-isomerase